MNFAMRSHVLCVCVREFILNQQESKISHMKKSYAACKWKILSTVMGTVYVIDNVL